MILDKLFGLFSNDLAIDLGTANTLIYAKGKGIVLCEPSVVAVRKDPRGGKRVVAVGREAKEMLGRTPGSITAIRPMKDGVIADFEVTEAMLRYFITRAHNRKTLVHPRIIICVPFGITEVEKRAVRESAESAGAREVYLIEEPCAAALGAGLPVSDVRGSMVVDIGGGTTEVAIISMYGIVVSRSLRVAGDELDQDIITYIRNKYNLFIGERMSEQVKMQIGSAFPLQTEKTMVVRGRNLVSGLPESIEVSSVEIREAVAGSVQVIVDTIKDALDEAPPEIVSDLIETGVCLAGGGAQLLGLSDRLSEELRLRVWVAEDPMTCVARGAGIVLEDLDRYAPFIVSLERSGSRS